MASKITELVFGRNRVSSLQNIQNDLMSSASSGYGGYECCDTGVDPALWLTLLASMYVFFQFLINAQQARKFKKVQAKKTREINFFS